MLKTLAWLAVGLVGGAVLVSWLQPLSDRELEAEVGAARTRPAGNELDLERELANQSRRLGMLEQRIDELAAALETTAADRSSSDDANAEDADAELAARIAVIENRLTRLTPARMPVADGNADGPGPEALAAALAAQGYTDAAENIMRSINAPPSPNAPPSVAAGPAGNVARDVVIGSGRNVPPGAGGGSAPNPLADPGSTAASSPPVAERRADERPPAGPPEAPPTLSGVTAEPGQTFVFRVTGSTQGPVWGTDIYTDDSSIGAAAVHAGLLRPDETGTVMVTILPGYSSYVESTRYGVASSSYAEWGRSFVLQRIN